MQSLERGLIRIEQVYLGTSMVALLAMMVFVSIDAISRYVFAKPLQFQYELTENYLMVAAILLPLAHVTRNGKHIAVDAFHHLLPSVIIRPLSIFGNIAMIALLAAVTYESGIKAYDAFRLRESTFGVIDWPVGWSRIWVPLGCGLFALRLLFDTCMNRDPTAHADLHEGDE